MSLEASDDHEHDFTTRVIPLLRSAMVRRDADAHRHGWFFEAVNQHHDGYRVIGHRNEPSICWSLLDDRLMQISAQPGTATVVRLSSFDAALAETLVSKWWAAVMP